MPSPAEIRVAFSTENDRVFLNFVSHGDVGMFCVFKKGGRFEQVTEGKLALEITDYKYSSTASWSVVWRNIFTDVWFVIQAIYAPKVLHFSFLLGALIRDERFPFGELIKHVTSLADGETPSCSATSNEGQPAIRSAHVLHGKLPQWVDVQGNSGGPEG